MFIRWLLARKYASRGCGPFSSVTLRALLRSECMQCGKSVNDFALLGNAIVVEKGRVVIHCRACREGGIHRATYVPIGNVCLSSLVVEIERHRCSESGEKLNWHQTLICVRRSYAYFQRTYHRPYEAFIRDQNRVSFGELLSISNCAECGAFWSNDKTIPVGSLDEKGTLWNNSACWHCGLSHSLQWHMRTTREAEQNLLHSPRET